MPACTAFGVKSRISVAFVRCASGVGAMRPEAVEEETTGRELVEEPHAERDKTASPTNTHIPQTASPTRVRAQDRALLIKTPRARGGTPKDTTRHHDDSHRRFPRSRYLPFT
jgi:hypothetical protein